MRIRSAFVLDLMLIIDVILILHKKIVPRIIFGNVVISVKKQIVRD